MQINEIKQELKQLQSFKDEINSLIDLHRLELTIKELDQETYDQAFWNNQERAQKVTKELTVLKKKHARITSFNQTFENIKLLVEFMEMGEDMVEEYQKETESFKAEYEALSVALLLQYENDSLNAVLEIHPGAGGTESQDWADMLFRMYKRYGEKVGYEFELLDYLDGEEAGLKSVTFSFKGEHAYGYLKAENGVHRLVRISPFDSGGRRHTSFASVNVYPEVDESIDIEIHEKDLKIDTYRSSGAGGQSVNTTDSAVRITHLPTKTVVTVQNERSQIKNREKALSILKGKLYQLELQKKQEELASMKNTSVSNSFGSQIRSYVMHPYSMVKDHRTNIETGNVSKVMDGDIEGFINGYLKLLAKEDEREK